MNELPLFCDRVVQNAPCTFVSAFDELRCEKRGAPRNVALRELLA